MPIFGVTSFSRILFLDPSRPHHLEPLPDEESSRLCLLKAQQRTATAMSRRRVPEPAPMPTMRRPDDEGCHGGGADGGGGEGDGGGGEDGGGSSVVIGGAGFGRAAIKGMAGGKGEGGGGEDVERGEGGGEGGGKQRGPQSLQSSPSEQMLHSDPGPPSLQSPSDAAL